MSDAAQLLLVPRDVKLLCSKPRMTSVIVGRPADFQSAWPVF